MNYANSVSHDPHKALQQYIEQHGLNSTRQRDAIVATFFALKNQHVSIDELLSLVRKKHPRVGYATVYRTLLLLVEAGLATQSHFNDGQSRFEVTTDHHHDHLICTECKTIVEFENETIENLQESIAKKHRFTLTGHKMELYGLCPSCQKRG